MTYHSNFVAAIKVEGKVLRENQSTVILPFNSEWSLLLKNLNSVRALVNVSIDGKDVLGGQQLILGPNQSLDLERFLDNGNMSAGNKFKFISRTPEIENYRGIGAEDGIVRVEYTFEVIPQQYNCNMVYLGSSQTSPVNTNMSFLRSMNVCVQSASIPEENGITVKGSRSDQKFVTGSWFPTENTSHVIILELKGKVAGKPVAQPFTVQQKPTCTSCGKVNKATNSFCGRCGTSLQLFS